MARTSGSDGGRTAEAIRRAAVELIARDGFAAMTMRELAERVGVQPGSIYRYFPSKSALLVDLQLEHLNFLLARWHSERPAGTHSPRLLRAFIAFHIREHTLRRQDAFVANMELRSLDAPSYRKVVTLRRRYEEQLIGILRAGDAAGDFALADPKITAYAILAMLTGVGSWYNEAGRIGKQELIELYTNLVMKSVAPAASPARRVRGESLEHH